MTDAPAGTYTDLSAGILHSCAIAADGTLACWGDNEVGLTDAPAGTYKALSVGSVHSCAIAADGAISCWGYDEFGQTDSPAGAYKAVTAGLGHNCAIAADDTVTCWGSNDSGQLNAPAGTYRSVAAGAGHSCAIATDDTLVCWGPLAPPPGVRAVSYVRPGRQPEEPESEPEPELEPEPESEPEPEPESEPEPEPEPEPAAEGSGDPERPGEGVTVVAGRANWSQGYFQAALHRQLLEELGYSVTDPAQLELSTDVAYTVMAQGRMDYWPNSWYPGHYQWLEHELPDGSSVGDHVSVVGELLFEGVLSGFVVTKSFADAYSVYTMDDLNSSPEALAAFDATDLVPGNGKAEIYGCPPGRGWACHDIINSMIAFSGWDNIIQLTGDYNTYIEFAHRDAGNGVPMVIYVWAPSPHIARLRPGDNVYWLGVDDILDDSNPTGVEGGEEHDQRGPDGTGGYVSIGADQCPSATEQPDGRCPIGWRAGHILVTANNEFLNANPAARALFEAVRLTPLDVSLANVAQREDGAQPDDLASQWIADNRDKVDSWLAVARAAS